MVPDRRKLAARIVRRGLYCRALVPGALAGALALTLAFPPHSWLVWNVSESAPVGLYAIGGCCDIGAGDMVLARVPEQWRSLAAGRRYIPANVPLVKRAAAVPGDTVCAYGGHIFVNGHRIAERRTFDGLGRPMPWWTGCVTLHAGAHFLLMDNPASFDGRYFGPTGQADVIGRARLLWRR